MGLKERIRQYLNIQDDTEKIFSEKLQRNIDYLDKCLLEHKKEILIELKEHNYIEVDYLIMEQRLDALCDLLGIDITADHMTGGGNAIITSIVRDPESLDKSKSNVEKVLAAEKIIQLQMETYRRINQLIGEMK